MSNPRRQGRHRRAGFLETKRFVVVAFEGAATEPKYFELFRTPREKTVQYKPVNNPKHKSKPSEVLQRLSKEFQKYKKKDEGWLVIDRDAWTETDLNAVCRDAREQGLHVALSNPCFELWLYLHLRDNTAFADRHDCQRRLAAVLTKYSPEKKGDYDAEPLKEHIARAIARAAVLDIHPHTPWPTNQCTRVYKLVQSLQASS
jgi:hypothetical protein